MVKKGELYYANLSGSEGSEQSGIRPILILQNNIGNKYSPTTIIASITKHEKKMNMPTHVLLNKSCGLKERSIVMLEQIRTIDINARLKEKIGECDKKTMQLIDKAIKVSFDLN
ncbi:MAG: type II toxin-antitoxin system PemK/MazF family toxin [archaeon]